MQDLVSAVGKTLPRLTSIFICLLLIFYVYAVLCTSLYIDLYDQGHLNYPYFERLDYTFITLFQFMTLDSWHGVVRQVQEVKPWSWLCFYSFAILTAFVVLNLIVAVVCEAVVELNAGKAREKSEEQSRIMIESAPVDEMVGQQADLQKAQMELERTLELIMKRIPQAS
jgi:p-aminobenzoyl-glutamate transporter AbgT